MNKGACFPSPLLALLLLFPLLLLPPLEEAYVFPSLPLPAATYCNGGGATVVVVTVVVAAAFGEGGGGSGASGPCKA